MKLKRDWIGQVYHSSFSSNSRGVAILIHRAIPFVLDTCKRDSEGRYFLVHGTIYGVHVTMMNIYAPNPPSNSGTGIAAVLEEYKCDFNCCLNNKLDRTPTNTNRKINKGASLIKMLDDISLIDVWRTFNQSARDQPNLNKLMLILNN